MCCFAFESITQASKVVWLAVKILNSTVKMGHRHAKNQGTQKSATHIWPPMCSSPLEKQSVTYLPSARLMERNRGYSSGAGLPCWSSYRKTGARPTSTPSCWMPCWLYTDSRKDWRPALGLIVNRMEKSSGKTPPEGGTSSRYARWYVSKDQRICSYRIWVNAHFSQRFYSIALLQIHTITHMGTAQYNHSIST